jgi:hypothetical protein
MRGLEVGNAIEKIAVRGYCVLRLFVSSIFYLLVSSMYLFARFELALRIDEHWPQLRIPDSEFRNLDPIG